MTYRKRAIPQATRRAVARRHGCPEPGQVIAVCAYCLNVGVIHWHALYSGRASGWVQFADLELHHVIPESRGGAASPANIVLACQPCNRSIRDRIKYPPGARFHEWLTTLFSESLTEPLTQTPDLTVMSGSRLARGRAHRGAGSREQGAGKCRSPHRVTTGARDPSTAEPITR